jgi:prepilin-type processing-associated H-X9-DG protein
MRHALGRRRESTAGFTIIELLIVTTCVSLLLALFAPKLQAARERTRVVHCLANLRTLAAAAVAYSAEDNRNLVIPVHPTANVNAEHDDGFFDFGGGDGLEVAWSGSRIGPNSSRNAVSRPLNRFLSLDVPRTRLYQCPSDRIFNPSADYPNWAVWTPVFREQSSHTVVGTSYWGNAVKSRSGEDWYSLGMFLRPLNRVPAPADTVLFMEMPMLFNLVVVGQERIHVGSHGLSGWHSSEPDFNLAFVDGHAAQVRQEAAWLGEYSDSETYEIRDTARLRFDCSPQPPIPDIPIARNGQGDGR